MSLKIYVLISSLLMLMSCLTNQQKELRDFIGSDINISGLDTINSNISNNEANALEKNRVIVWLDEEDCSICKLTHAEEWIRIYSFCNDSVSDAEFCMIFSVKPSLSKEKFYQTADSMKLPFTVLMDTCSIFYSSNPCIPTDNKLHVFLIDKESKVRLAGNPLFSQQMMNLYVKGLITDFKE